MVSIRAEIGSQFFLALAYHLSLFRYYLPFSWFCVVIITAKDSPTPTPLGIEMLRNCSYCIDKDIVFGKQENKHI